jgi:hypothetical protein
MIEDKQVPLPAKLLADSLHQLLIIPLHLRDVRMQMQASGRQGQYLSHPLVPVEQCMDDAPLHVLYRRFDIPLRNTWSLGHHIFGV